MAKIGLSLPAVIIHSEFCKPHKTMLAAVLVANPPEDLRVITLDQFSFLADRIKQLYEYVASAAKTSDVSVCVERGLESLGLKWPKCIDSLESSLAIDLKVVEPPQSVGGD